MGVVFVSTITPFSKLDESIKEFRLSQPPYSPSKPTYWGVKSTKSKYFYFKTPLNHDKFKDFVLSSGNKVYVTYKPLFHYVYERRGSDRDTVIETMEFLLNKLNELW